MTQHPGVWEERWHPLREEWIIVAAHRQNRPWIGQTVTTPPPRDPVYDPTCYLCPGNMRVSGYQNPSYGGVYVFDNDHPCVGPLAPPPVTPPWPYRARRADTGTARTQDSCRRKAGRSPPAALRAHAAGRSARRDADASATGIRAAFLS